MKGYFFVGNRQMHLDLPFVLIASVIDGIFLPCYDTKSLEDRVLQLREGKIDFEEMAGWGWDINELEIPDAYAREFIRRCYFEDEKNIEKFAKRIFRYAYDYYSDIRYQVLEEISRDSESGFENYNLYEKEEDEPEDWWKP